MQPRGEGILGRPPSCSGAFPLFRPATEGCGPKALCSGLRTDARRGAGGSRWLGAPGHSRGPGLCPLTAQCSRCLGLEQERGGADSATAPKRLQCVTETPRWGGTGWAHLGVPCVTVVGAVVRLRDELCARSRGQA